MKMSLLIGIGTGAIATYAVMSKGSMEKNMKKQGKKIMKKIQDLVEM